MDAFEYKKCLLERVNSMKKDLIDCLIKLSMLSMFFCFGAAISVEQYSKKDYFYWLIPGFISSAIWLIAGFTPKNTKIIKP